MWSSANQSSQNGVTSPSLGGGAPLGSIHPNIKHNFSYNNHSSSTHHHVSYCSSSSMDPNNSVFGAFNNNNTTNNNSGTWGNASTGGGTGVDGSVRVWRDGSSAVTTPYVGPTMPDNNATALRTPASVAIDDATLLCTPVVGRSDHLLPPGVTRKEGDAESVNNSTRHYDGGESEDGSVRSSGPLDTTFMQHSDARPSADGNSLHHNPHQDVSAMLDFTEEGEGNQQQPHSPVIMRRFDGSAGWVDIPKRWLSPLCDREIAQLHAIQTREAEMAAALEVESSSREAEEGPFLSVGRSRSVADATATTVACSSVTFTRSSALVSSSSSASNVATVVVAEPTTNSNDSLTMMGVGRRFRGVGRRGKAGRRGERDETGEDDVDPRHPSRLNMMPVNEDCGSPHRPRQQRRRRCEPIDADDKVDDHAGTSSKQQPPVPVSFKGFATVAYMPTNSIGTPQINRMLSRVELRSTEPRKLGGSYKDKPILSPNDEDDIMNGSAPARRPRSSASTDRPDPLSARGNYFAFVDVGSDDDEDFMVGSDDGGMLGASTSTVAARHLVFTEGHEEVETPEVLARRLQNCDEDVIDVADRFTRAVQQGEHNTAISRPLFEDDDEREEDTELSPHPSALVRMSTLTSDDAPASRGSTQPPEESIGYAPRRSGGRRSHNQ